MVEFLYIIRMLTASICGFLIGLERKNRAKEAGIRTHCVVACAAALMMIISKYGFTDMAIGADGMRGADGARIAAQVVSGIGFLGAGMIFVHKNTVTGLTTAAGIWATAGVGLAIGSGMYIVGIAAAAIIILVQVLFHLNFNWLKMPKSRKLTIKNVKTENFQKKTTELLENIGITVHEVYIEKDTETKTRKYIFVIEIPGKIEEETIINQIDYECKISSNM